MALTSFDAAVSNPFLAKQLAIADLPPEVQQLIQAKPEAFSEGDLDKIDTPNELKALQEMILGLDPAVMQANPELKHLLDPALLVAMMSNQMGPNQNNGVGNTGGGRDLGQMNFPSFGGGANRLGGGNPWSPGSNSTGGGTPVTGPAAASYPSNLNGDRAQQAMTYLQQELGLTREQAAGVVGNLAVESGGDLDPTAIGDGGNALGIAQWNGPRKRALEAFAAQQGKPATDFGVQLQFLAHELRTSESRAFDTLRGTTTAADAALVFSRDFERPGIPHNDRRVAMAEQALRTVV